MPPGLGEILAESGDLTLRRLRRASDWRRLHGGTIDRALLATVRTLRRESDGEAARLREELTELSAGVRALHERIDAAGPARGPGTPAATRPSGTPS